MSNEEFDLNALMEQAQQMQEQVAAAQEKQAQQVLTGTAGGGSISVQVTGAGDFEKVTIDPSAVNPQEVQLLEELILAALRDATAKINSLQDEAIEAMDMPDFGNMLGN